MAELQTVIGRELIRLESVDSTNTYVRTMAGQGAAEGLAVIGREQTAGRGRRGRRFESAAGLGLYLSVLLRPQMPPEQAADLTAWAAVAVCEGIREGCGLTPRIKWTNDLVLNGKKLCGILTESVLDGQGGLDCTVLGLGVNVNHRPEQLGEEIRDMATSLAIELGHPVEMEPLIQCILRSLDDMYRRFPRDRAEFVTRYRALCLTPGNPVRLITPAGTREGYALDVDDRFRLLVRLADGSVEAVSTGEVSVRGMYGYV